ncbi:MAG: PIG-L family deacetylase [bacterium]|nr:PIG-L family deacetylase [bacterium]
MKKCVMAFGAHSDDIEIQCGGTLLKFKSKGYELIYVVVTTNDMGFSHGYKENIEVRRKEAEKGAKFLGAMPLFLNFKKFDIANDKNKIVSFIEDSNIFNKWKKLPGREPISVAFFIPECVIEVANLIAKYEPEIVLTHSPDDIHPDHHSTSVLVYRAFKEASEKMKLGSLYLWGPGSWGFITEFNPDIFIDISNYIDKKNEAISQHASQAVEWIKTYFGERTARWGKKIGVKHAEGFYKVKDILTKDKISYINTLERRFLEYKKRN